MKIDGEELRLGEKRYLWPDGEWRAEMPPQSDEPRGFYEFTGQGVIDEDAKGCE